VNNNFREDYKEYREYLMHSMPTSAREAQRRQEERDRLISRHNQRSQDITQMMRNGQNEAYKSQKEAWNHYFSRGIGADTIAWFMREKDNIQWGNNIFERLVNECSKKLAEQRWATPAALARELLTHGHYVELLRKMNNPPSNPGLAQPNHNPMDVISSAFHNRSRRRR
jgi:hypothetical protein